MVGHPIKKKHPPGTVKLEEGKFIDFTPIDNFAWQEYLFFVWNGKIQTNFDPPYLDKMEDCVFVENEIDLEKCEVLSAKSFGFVTFELNSDTVWNNHNLTYKIKKSVTLGRLQLEPDPYDFPVLDINKKEAIDYCEWRTNVVMHNYSRMNKVKRKRYFKNIRYRLPTSLELNKAKEKLGSSFEVIDSILHAPIHIYNFKEQTLDDGQVSLKRSIDNTRHGFRCICEILEE